jgi:hypothetical protein
MPPQHCRSLEHASPVCRQNDTRPSHVVPLHTDEQHWLLLVHGLPDVLHPVFSGAHLAPAQLPPQQSADAVHPPLSATHCVAPHTPPAHTCVQQSIALAHAAPAALHVVVTPTG